MADFPVFASLARSTKLRSRRVRLKARRCCNDAAYAQVAQLPTTPAGFIERPITIFLSPRRSIRSRFPRNFHIAEKILGD